MPLYHYQIGFPSDFTRPTNNALLTYSRHALEALSDEMIATVPFTTISLKSGTLVELNTNYSLPRYVFRFPFTAANDLVMVLQSTGNQSYRVVTCWLNSTLDNHSTLRRELYANA